MNSNPKNEKFLGNKRANIKDKKWQNKNKIKNKIKNKYKFLIQKILIFKNFNFLRFQF